MILLIALDLLTKSQARQALAGGPVELIPGVFELRYLENHGAAFGIMQNKRIFFILITLVFLALAVFYFLKLPTDRRYRPMRIITTFVVAGAIASYLGLTGILWWCSAIVIFLLINGLISALSK